VLRSCLVALRLADHLGLRQEERCETYWVTLLATVCTGESLDDVTGRVRASRTRPA